MENKAMSKESLASGVSVINLEPLNMSSTAKLTDHRIRSKDPGYDPFQYRQVEHPNSDLGTLAHFLKSSLGTGVLAMPNAFKNGGMAFGLAGTLVVGFICTHCVHILVKSSHTLCRREKVPSLGFAETAEMAFKSGPPGFQKYSTFSRKFVNGSLVVTYYSALCVYVVFVATSFQQVLQYYYGKDLPVLDTRVLIAITLVPIIPICLVRDLKYLVPFSAIANLFIVVSFGITLYYIFREPLSFDDRELLAGPEKIPMFFAIVIFAMEGIGTVMPLENEMKTPQHFLGCPGVINIAMIIVVGLYASVGFFGYLKYGSDVEGSITFNLKEDEVLAQCVKILYGLAILFSYGLQYYVPTSIVWPAIEEKIPEKNRNLVQNAFRIFAAICTVAIAAAVPKLGPIISLVGAVCFSTLGLFCPAMIETITHWDSGLGAGNWRLWKNSIIMIFSILALVTGSYTSILEIIETY